MCIYNVILRLSSLHSQIYLTSPSFPHIQIDTTVSNQNGLRVIFCQNGKNTTSEKVPKKTVEEEKENNFSLSRNSIKGLVLRPVQQASYFKQVVLLLFFHNSNGQHNSPSVEFWWQKIEGNLRWANKEPSMHFLRVNTEPSMDFRKPNTEPSMHVRRANTETYQKKNVNLSKRVRKDGVFLGLAGQLLPCHPFSNLNLQ